MLMDEITMFNTILNASLEDITSELKLLSKKDLNIFVERMEHFYFSVKVYKEGLLQTDLTAEELESTLKNVYITLQKIENIITIGKELQN